MSAALLDQVKKYLREAYTPKEVVDVREYAGEFNAAEMSQLGYSCPAILLTVLGWESLPPGGKHRLGGRHARMVRCAAFVVTKHAEREKRMRAALLLADSLAVRLRDWLPANPEDRIATLAPLDEEPTVENLYSRAVDKVGQALWLLTWQQAAAPVLAAGHPSALVDWLSAELHSTAHAGQPGASGPVVDSAVIIKEP